MRPYLGVDNAWERGGEGAVGLGAGSRGVNVEGLQQQEDPPPRHWVGARFRFPAFWRTSVPGNFSPSEGSFGVKKGNGPIQGLDWTQNGIIGLKLL